MFKPTPEEERQLALVRAVRDGVIEDLKSIWTVAPILCPGADTSAKISAIQTGVMSGLISFLKAFGITDEDLIHTLAEGSQALLGKHPLQQKGESDAAH